MNKEVTLAIKEYKSKIDLRKSNESKWLSQYLELVNYKKLHGHVDVPAIYPKNKSLGRWVRKQRYNHSIDKLLPDRQYLLKLIDFNFRLLNYSDWNTMYSLLCKELKKNKDRSIGPESTAELFTWVNYQRKLYWKGKLETDKLKKLKKVGVDMRNKTLFRFEENWNKLKAFHKKNNHCYVCVSYGADKKLINFVKGLRRSKEDLDPKTISALDKIGFDWETERKVTKSLNRERGKKAWLKRYHELYHYQKKFGHCFILTTDLEHNSLAQWISIQRNHFHVLSKEQIHLLNDIGFFKDNAIKIKKP